MMNGTPLPDDYDAAYVANALRKRSAVVRWKNRVSARVLRAVARCAWAMRRRGFRNLADRDRVLQVRLGDIKYVYRDSRIRKCSVPGAVMDGDWDRTVIPWTSVLAHSTKFAGIRQHFAEGVPWEETVLFKNRYARVWRGGGRVRGQRAAPDLARAYEKYDCIFASMQQRGVVSPDEDGTVDPIHVHINRNGEFLSTSNGNHRLFMAVLLGIGTIPVRVWWRHAEWQKIRETYAGLTDAERRARYPHLVAHPDLQDL
jgi:hypothetical protein